MTLGDWIIVLTLVSCTIYVAYSQHETAKFLRKLDEEKAVSRDERRRRDTAKNIGCRIANALRISGTADLRFFQKEEPNSYHVWITPRSSFSVFLLDIVVEADTDRIILNDHRRVSVYEKKDVSVVIGKALEMVRANA